VEYFQYCNYCYPNDPYPKILDACQVYKFMFYQTFRSRKERGGARVNSRTEIKFDPLKYNEVIKLYETWMLGNTGIQPPEPKKTVQLSTMQRLREGIFNLGMMVKEGFDDMIRERESTAVKVAAFHSVMAASLGTTSKRKGTSYDVVSKRARTSSPMQHDGSPPTPDISQHRLAMKHHSLHTLYNKWYGLGEYFDLPGPGGIAALEASEKTKWRKHFSPNEIKNCSRVKMIVAGIDAMQCRLQRDTEMAIEELDLIFTEEAKKSVTSSMVIIMQTMGLVSKKKS
jgi:hypothetical protein